jgi:hypothetical protein
VVALVAVVVTLLLAQHPLLELPTKDIAAVELLIPAPLMQEVAVVVAVALEQQQDLPA